MLDELKQEGGLAHPGVKNLIIVLLWMPLLILLYAATVGLGFIIYRTGRYGTVPDITGLSEAVNGQLAVIAIVAAVAFLYWTLIRATFGGEFVDNSADSAGEVVDEYAPDGGKQE